MNQPNRPDNWDEMGSSEKDLWEERQSRAARRSRRTIESAHREGYVEALADINACLATVFGSDAERIARIEEWIKNNTRPEDQPLLQAAIAEFLS